MIEMKQGLNPVVLDIETTDLNAYFGYIVCVCLKPYKGPITTLRIDDPRNPDKNSDKWLIKELVKEMNKYDVAVTWNGIMFDRKFINARAMIHRIKLPNKLVNRDLCNFARAKFRMPNNRLATWNTIMDGTTGKTITTPKVKYAAIRGEKWAIDFIVHHCKLDVQRTEKRYIQFLPYLNDKIKKV